MVYKIVIVDSRIDGGQKVLGEENSGYEAWSCVMFMCCVLKVGFSLFPFFFLLQSIYTKNPMTKNMIVV